MNHEFTILFSKKKNIWLLPLKRFTRLLNRLENPISIRKQLKFQKYKENKQKKSKLNLESNKY